MGINLGAFFSPLICGGIGDTGNIHDFRYGFLTACIGMVVSVITFELLKGRFLNTPEGEPIGMPRASIDPGSSAVVIGSVGLIFFLLNFKKLFHVDYDSDRSGVDAG